MGRAALHLVIPGALEVPSGQGLEGNHGLIPKPTADFCLRTKSGVLLEVAGTWVFFGGL